MNNHPFIDGKKMVIYLLKMGWISMANRSHWNLGMGFFVVQTNDGERYLVTLEIPESTGVLFTHQLGPAILA